MFDLTGIGQKALTTDPRRLPELLNDTSLPALLSDPAAAAFASYYQRVFPREQQVDIERHYQRQRKSAVDSGFFGFAPLVGRNRRELHTIFREVAAIQPTIGCTAGVKAGCSSWCAFDAIPNRREHIPFPVIEALVKGWNRFLRANQTSFYFASDLSDYVSVDAQGKKVGGGDLVRLLESSFGYHPFISTVAPHALRGVRLNRVSVHGRRNLLGKPDHLGWFDWYSNRKSLKNISIGGLGLSERLEDQAQLRNIFGIGCFNGALITPRGVYSVVQHFGLNDASPQRQLVIPFLGGKADIPKVGDDVRLVMAKHMPLLTWMRQPLGDPIVPNLLNKYIDILQRPVPSTFLIQNPGSRRYEPLIVVCESTKVSQVTKLESYELRNGALLWDVAFGIVDKLNEAGSKISGENRVVFHAILWQLAQVDVLERFLADVRRALPLL